MAEETNITTWNRLEPSPRSEDFQGALQAKVRDPLWMLSRQWQMGEFTGENTGSAVKAQVKLNTYGLFRYKSANAAAARTLSGTEPLEPWVEHEDIPMDFAMRLEIGRQFLTILHDLLDAAGKDPLQFDAQFQTATAPAQLKIEVPEDTLENAAINSNPALKWMIRAAARGSGFNGGELYTYLSASPFNKASDFLTSPNSTVDKAGHDLASWFQSTYKIPSKPNESAWMDEQLEYQFSVAAPLSRTVTVGLKSDEYDSGHLDWYAFEADKASGSGVTLLNNTSGNTSSTMSMIPSGARFPGMPLSRYWEMEDGHVNPAALHGEPDHPAAMIFGEYALMHSNDWMVIPVMMPIGSLAEIEEVIVRDVFGQRTKILSVTEKHPNDRDRWNFMGISGFDASENYLFVPPVADHVQEGKPFEQVLFTRDEMANMVWAVEQRVSNGIGGGMDGRETARKFPLFLQRFALPAETEALLENSAEFTYKLANTIPEHWIPFIPIYVPGKSRSVQLQRSALPRYISGLGPTRILPRTGILLDPGAGFKLHEEEVPRSGSQVQRSWQRLRWLNGETIVWVGRRRKNGKGEGSSGLAFDQLIRKES